MEALTALLAVILIGLLIVLRMRRRPRQPQPQEESMFVTAPARSIEEAVQSRQSRGTSPRPALFSDRLLGGIVAALLLGGIVFALEVTGVGGPLGVILAMPVAAFPPVEDKLGSLFSGIATVAVVAFAVGFAYPRLVNRIA
jgi:predicted lipid-binding transport protein (Tim44 family)